MRAKCHIFTMLSETTEVEKIIGQKRLLFSQNVVIKINSKYTCVFVLQKNFERNAIKGFNKSTAPCCI